MWFWNGVSSTVTLLCYTPARMPDLLAALDAFLREHRRCGEFEAGVEGERMWMRCDCGAQIVQSAFNEE